MNTKSGRILSHMSHYKLAVTAFAQKEINEGWEYISIQHEIPSCSFTMSLSMAAVTGAPADGGFLCNKLLCSMKC